MTTSAGTLLDFIRCIWTVAAPGTVDIVWTYDWWDSRYPALPQVTVSNYVTPHLQTFNTGGSLAFKYKPMYLVNVWQQVPAGSSGTQELANVDAMRSEIARLFRTYFSGTATATGAYAGSLGPFRVVLPDDYGIARHELAQAPRMLRYEIRLMSTRDSE